MTRKGRNTRYLNNLGTSRKKQLSILYLAKEDLAIFIGLIMIKERERRSKPC